MKPKGINWAEIAPKYDALGRGNTAGKQALAKAYGIDSVGAMITGLSAWRKKRIGTPMGTTQELRNSGEPLGTDEVPKNSSVPLGTPERREDSPAPMGTVEVPRPMTIDMYERFMSLVSAQGDLLAAVSAKVDKQGVTLRDVAERLSPQVDKQGDTLRDLAARVSALEPLVKAHQQSLEAVPLPRYSRIKQALPTWVQNLTGIPGYPHDGGRDSRLNIHLPEAERWLMQAIATGLEENISGVVRRILTAWLGTDEAQKGLRAYLEQRGVELT